MEILARAVGRRKEAVAQVQLVRGNGQFIINDKPAQTYLQNNSCSLICIKSPLQTALGLFSTNPLVTSSSIPPVPTMEVEGQQLMIENLPNDALPALIPLSEGDKFASQGEIDIIIKVKGGGLIGQAEAIKLGVARAFCIMENASGGALLRKMLKTQGYLTQDSRVKERRKYGLKKARKASQYHKR